MAAVTSMNSRLTRGSASFFPANRAHQESSSSAPLPSLRAGLRREDKNKWERRTPLTPSDSRSLVAQGLRVLVQPSSRRIFPDAAYVDAGCELAEDLGPCGTILAVKEVPVPLLLPARTYAFFSHTIKGQPQNMPLLDALLRASIRLVDYECVTDGGVRGGQRRVAFGRYAGLAGAIDICRGLGERLLALGHSTPFLGVASTYQYADLAAALAAVKACGDRIARDGLPEAVSPLTIVVTGAGRVASGAREVLEQLPVRWVHPFELARIVATATGAERTHVVYAAVATAEHMYARRPGAPGAPARSTHQLLVQAEKNGGISGSLSPRAGAGGTPTAAASVVGPATTTTFPLDVEVDESAFDKSEFKQHPDRYEAVFPVKIAPFASVVLNCVFWEPRFPRLLTCDQIRALKQAGRLRLVAIGDISCDLEGSLECLREFTSIESPFRVYDPETTGVTADLDAPGILYQAVDHLPSECPLDASVHFSACLLPLLPLLARSKEGGMGGGGGEAAPTPLLPPELAGAIVCARGALAPNFSYIAGLREAASRAELGRGLRRARTESFVTLRLAGHLFDKQVVNRALDLVEDRGLSAQVVDFRVGRDRSTPTEMRLQVFARAGPGGGTLAAIIEDLRGLAESAGATLGVEDGSGADAVATTGAAAAAAAAAAPSSPRVVRLLPGPSPAQPAPRRVLVLGAGHVSGPVVEYLLRRPTTHVTVASVLREEAERVAGGRARTSVAVVDVAAPGAGDAGSALGLLVAAHDLVVSIVPAFLHLPVARHALAHRRHFVSSSYVSPEMAALNDEAVAAGVVLLNEAGLDPGIDHMAAARMIDAVADAGGVVRSFTSVCGGLPAPEAATNPLGYKFSWAPRGALAAMRNPARYLRDGNEVRVEGPALLAAAAPFPLPSHPSLAFEVLPNRDSLPYADKYGIGAAHTAGKEGSGLVTMFRGTLRYAGFAKRMRLLAGLGLLDAAPAALPAPGGKEEGGGWTCRALTAHAAGLAPSASDGAIAAAALLKAGLQPADGGVSVREAAALLRWAGLLSDAPAPVVTVEGGKGGVPAHHIPLDTTAALLSANPSMAFAPGERDMAFMRHEVEADFPAAEVVAASDGGGGSGDRQGPRRRRERRTATLMEFAQPAAGAAAARVGGGLVTAMARTVGFTAAIAAQLILDGAVPSARRGGVVTPVTRDWYGPILEALEGEGIVVKEEVEEVDEE
jgi:alpha-aminoadipic semialdehyde synthase